MDAILDATARILAREGSGAVTMGRVASMSRTSTGSMYHFFPDREALIHALAARHRDALREILTKMERDAAPAWPQLSTSEAVDDFLDPVIRYADANPDLPAVRRFLGMAGVEEHRDARLDELFVRLGKCLVASRVPGCSSAELATRAMAMIGIVEGLKNASRQHTPSPTNATNAALRQEMRRAMVAYLDSFHNPESGRHAQHARTTPDTDGDI